MIWLDAYGLVAMLGREPAAPRIRDLFGSERLSMTTVNLAEAVDVLSRVHDLRIADTRQDIIRLKQAGMSVVEVTEEVAWRAATLRARHYRRGKQAVSMADCVLLAAAAAGDGVATADPGVAEVARLESVRLIALPDRAGRLP